MGTWTGNVSDGEDDLELVYMKRYETSLPWQTGVYVPVLRWTNVNVPQGATITDLRLTGYAPDPDITQLAADGGGKWFLEPDCPSFAGMSYEEINGLPTVGFGDGNAYWWVTEAEVQLYPGPSPGEDWLGGIQAVVDQMGWVSGNALGCRLGTDSGVERSFSSYEGAAPVELYIEWEGNGPAPPPPEERIESYLLTGGTMI